MSGHIFGYAIVWSMQKTTYHICKSLIIYADGVHLRVIWENTALVQRIRLKALTEQLIHWIGIVFSIFHKKETTFIFSYTTKSHMT